MDDENVFEGSPVNVRLHPHAQDRLQERGATEEEVVMKLSYDVKCNIAYIRFHEKVGQVTTIKISDEMNIDIAPNGQRD